MFFLIFFSFTRRLFPMTRENSAKDVEKVVACENEALEVVDGAVAEVVGLLVVSTVMDFDVY